MEVTEANKISVIVPLYNSEFFLSDFINSIRAQTFQHWELIFVDDGSKDGGPDIIETFSKKDKRIKLLRRPENQRKGANTCRNIGLLHSEGKYVIWFDADDLVAPYCLKQRFQFMEENPSIDIGIFPALGFQKNIGDWNGIYFGYKSEEKAINNLINKNLPFAVWTNIYRKKSLTEKNLKWDEKLISLQDSDFNICTLIKGLSFKEINAPADYFWRKTPGSISSNILSNSHYNNHIYFLDKLFQLLINSPQYKQDLILASFWTYNIIYFAPKEFKSNFFNIKYLKKNPILAWKIYALTNLKYKITNKRLLSLFHYFISPISTIRNRWLNKKDFIPFYSQTNLNQLIKITEKELSHYSS